MQLLPPYIASEENPYALRQDVSAHYFFYSFPAHFSLTFHPLTSNAKESQVP
jgi:hypothetical protein